MTPSTPSGPQTARTGAHGGRDLYAPMPWAVLRAPLLPVDAAPPAAAAPRRETSDPASLLPSDPRVRAAIAVASPDLTAALAATAPGSGHRACRLRGKVLRYLLRMSARPTPYGLFAGVGLVGWGASTDAALDTGRLRTRTRPDMQWLLDLVSALEEEPAVRAGLRLVANRAVLLRGGRLFLHDTGSGVSVRASATVRAVLDAAALEPVPFPALVEAVATESVSGPVSGPVSGSGAPGPAGPRPAPTREKAEQLVDELRRLGFLQTDLNPPLTGRDPLDHVRGRLADIPAAGPTAAGLAGLSAATQAWDGLACADRVQAWPDLSARMRNLCPGVDGSDLLQTDLALALTGSRLHRAVGAEAARAAELLLRISPHPNGPPQLADYRRSFEARYGTGRRVPLLELLDAEFGLGPPGSHRDPSFPARDAALRGLALRAGREREPVVELDDHLLERLQTWTPEVGAPPPTLELPVFVAAASRAAVDAGDFRLVVGPNVGPGGAGRSLGRFADLLGPGAAAALAQVAQAEAAASPGTAFAEVVYTPQPRRLANVVVRPSVHPLEIVFGAWPAVAPQQVVPVDELVVGVEGDRFTVSWPRGGGLRIAAVQGHMLHPGRAPAAARFLLDVTDENRCGLAPFDWGGAGAFPFLPRVQRGRIVLSLAQWRLDPVRDELPAEPPDGFADALAAWRERWLVPRHVYLTVADNRLLLDLDDSSHRELLREDLLRQQGPLVLQEALPGPEDAWLPGAEGGHLCEINVSLALRPPADGGTANAARASVRPRPAQEPTRPAPAPGLRRPLRPQPPVDADSRLRLPGSDWLYVKVYAARAFHEDVIGGPLRALTEFALNARLADGWFFVRYADPKPHLRLRFHGEPANLLGPLLAEVCDWASDLVAEGVCSHFALDTYEREVERYGGDRGLRAAEAVFGADSAAVCELVHLGRAPGLPYDRLTLAALSIDDLLDGLRMGPAARTELYRQYGRPQPRDGAEYRRRKQELRSLLGRPRLAPAAGPGSALDRLLASRRAALAAPAEQLASLDADALLHRPLADLCRSLVHLHVNRLLGIGEADEELVLQLLRRTREGLLHAPSH
ncbi:lantibiotic dehydratase [Kitasatospora sp. CM 4170]|uniref:lantibiotic dehydratase n=1 Tax=Kitasatospora TaxID=2063 RepID=UPI0028A8D304|nr:lantibiotic dehydratase [Kitasatospora sp. CM 4170]WNM43248.1 lantibiotic dehydratase [Kitasatospora sp. CM 4170]